MGCFLLILFLVGLVALSLPFLFGLFVGIIVNAKCFYLHKRNAPTWWNVLTGIISFVLLGLMLFDAGNDYIDIALQTVIASGVYGILSFIFIG